jgi:hypothetical protein
MAAPQFVVRSQRPPSCPLAPLHSIRDGTNDLEVTMSSAVSNTQFVAYTKALEAAGTAIKLVVSVPGPLKPIADQLIRA